MPESFGIDNPAFVNDRHSLFHALGSGFIIEGVPSVTPKSTGKTLLDGICRQTITSCTGYASALVDCEIDNSMLMTMDIPYSII